MGVALYLNRRLRYYFFGPSSALTLWPFVSQWQSASDEDWALALAREAVIRLLTDQPEVTEELVVTASAELGISRSLVYRLVAKFRTAAVGFANRSGVVVLALFTDDHSRAPAKFQRSGLSTILSQWIGLQSTNIAKTERCCIRVLECIACLR